MTGEPDPRAEETLDAYFIEDPSEEKTPEGTRLRRFLPNFLTLCGLSAGLLAIQKAVNNQWDDAVLLITFAAIVDTMDGALARLLQATSKFGAELDSLADFLSFGVAPAFVMYLWTLDNAGPVGWVAVLVFALCSALRLARFNTLSEIDPRPQWARKFFMGVPAPCGAGLALMPLIASLQFPDFSGYPLLTPLIGIWMILIGLLMVSKLPTLSSKQVKLPASSAVPMLAAAGLFLAALVHMPWATLLVAGTTYAASILIGLKMYFRLKRMNAPSAPVADAA
ncbi:MAG: CDP-diacylglycerol--serine O-phosphatidyltransferase [Rhodospirillales bacterium]|nr:CDP-diacylglycerol--serine O-phosphatidyltransferase [Alphaproteobacteria bacterium]MCB9986565.1 CDP-diacylglycerol--serine O-phosphatidyltransferase [Rhodospirillales bacterium]USO06902.1 MAG: CDP-diacylglycerol--serine O-phosphatidyltransferase [Rhodospirillales bacterium]